MIMEIDSERYWLQQLDGDLAGVDPCGRTVPGGDGVDVKVYEVQIPGQLLHDVNAFTKGTELGRFCYFIAAFNILTYRYARETRTLIAVPAFTAGEGTAEGNVCFLRCSVDGRGSVKEMLNSIKSTVLNCIHHQKVPYRGLIGNLVSRNGQLDPAVFFNVGISDSSVHLSMDLGEKCGLMIRLNFGNDCNIIRFEFDNGYEPLFIQQVADHYLRVLGLLAIDPDATIDRIDLLNEVEKEELLAPLVAGGGNRPVKALHQLLEENAERYGSFPAASWNDQQLSYDLFNRKVNRLAHRLIREYKIGPGDVVAVCLHSSLDLPVAVFGVLKTGASVLPIVPGDAVERTRFLLQDSRTRLLISQKGMFAPDPGYNGQLLFPDDEDLLSGENEGNPGIDVDPGNTAYIIYTSGSTGKPKGVCLSHSNLGNLFEWYRTEFDLSAATVFPQKTTVSFVDSIVEMLLPVTVIPSCIYLRPYDAIGRDTSALCQWIEAIGTTIIQFVPSVFDFLMETEDVSKFGSLRTLILSGEAVKRTHQAGYDIYNLYGCSECSAVSTAARIGKGEITIGKPIAGTRVYILTEDLKPVPKGTKGELFVSGAGVSRGYLNNSALTAEKFLKSPFNDEVLYRTGDIAWLGMDGELRYAGRKDHQVKIRGVRIELGEIERTLVEHEQIQEAAVVVSEAQGDKELNAFIIKANNIEKEEEGKDCATGPLDFSLFYFASQHIEENCDKYRLLIDSVKYADKNGYKAVWVPERHFHAFGGIFPDPAVLCGALAMCTEHIELRAGSVVLPLHDEIRVAEQWAVVDNLSNGRVSLSFASGWHADDFVFFPQDYVQRHEKMYKQIPVVRSLWEGKKIERLNGLNKQISIGIAVRPVQRRIPVWITSGGTKDTFYNAGKIGAHIITNLLAIDFGGLAENISVYKRALRENGHDADAARITVMMHTFIGADLDTVREKVKEPFKKYLGSSLALITNLAISRGIDLNEGLSPELKDELLELGFERFWQSAALLGTPGSCDRLVRQLYAIGVNEIACLVDFGLPYENVMEGLEALTGFKEQYKRESDEVMKAKALQSVKESNLQKRQAKSFGTYEVQKFLEQRISPYMVPSNILFLEEFPKTASGKIDRRGLLKILESRSAKYVAPRNSLEEKLVTIWTDILGREKIGVKDKFTDLGGHSLKATRVISRIKKELDVEIRLRDLFAYPTIEELAKTINASHRVKFEQIPVAPEREYYDVSNSQKRIWIFDQSGISPLAYNLLHVYSITGSLNVSAFESAFKDLIGRHESLRTTFCNINGEVRQKVHRAESFPFEVEHIYLNESDEGEIWNDIEKRIQTETRTEFSLSKGPLLRVKLLHVKAESFVFILSLHHIIADGWSMNVLFRNLFQFYQFHQDGAGSYPSRLPIQYKDYTYWQNNRITRYSSSHREYWAGKLGGRIEPLNLPTDGERSDTRNLEGAHYWFSLSSETSDKIRAFNKRYDVTFFVSMVALIKVLLFKYTNQRDIIVGSPVSGRNHEDLEEQIGLFLNNLVLRDRINAGDPYLVFLEKVKDTVLEAFEHMDYPYDELVEELNVVTSPSRNPFYDVLVVTGAGEAFAGSGDSPMPEGSSLSIRMMGHETHISKLDLTFFFMEMDEVKVNIEYCTGLFREETIKRMGEHFTELVEVVLDDPHRTIAGIRDVLKGTSEIKEHAIYQERVLEKLTEDF